MGIFHLLLLFALIITNIINADPPDEVPLHVVSLSGDNYEINVNLKRIHSFLANENLPVWIVNAESSDNLEPLKNIMDDIGPFHMYQDVHSCAAAVYYHKEQHFEGTIDQRYIIKNYNPQANPNLVEGLNMIQSEELKHTHEHRNWKSSNSQDEVEFDHGKNWRYIKSRMEDSKIVYVETLVVVNYDVVAAFQNDYKALVSEMLVTFNSVDMMYASIDTPKVKINIAGIIIGHTIDSFPLIKDNCYVELKGTDNVALNIYCVKEAVKFTVDNYVDIIPRESYDVVVFLTKFYLYGIRRDADGKEKTVFLNGYAYPPEHDEYLGYTLSLDDIRFIAVQHLYDFQHFPIVTHEMAHLLDVWHELGDLWTSDGECDQNVMKSSGTYCEKCLYFGHLARQQMKIFFNSRDGCKFRNEPRSLKELWKPQLFWNEHKQCQCYGFLMAKKPQKIDCESRQRLKCSNGAGNKHETGFFMDGTLCSKNEFDAKVCWNGQCKRIEN